MDQKDLVGQSYQVLHKLTGLHRQLLEVVRLEREVLVQADVKAIETVTATKHSLIREIHQTETIRLKLTGELAAVWREPSPQLTLSQMILRVQSFDPKMAEQFRTTLNVLTLLIQRITTQNQDNKAFVEKSLGHLQEMKKNLLTEATSKSNTYSAQGTKKNGTHGARLISKEA